MKASGKSASRAPLPAISAHNDSILSIVAVRSKRTGSAWTHATFTASFIRASVRRAFRPVLRVRGDDVPDADLAVAQDVGVESAAMRQALDDPRLRHGLQVRARLAELGTLAFHVADAEALADQCVDVDSARHDVTPCRRGLQRDAVLVLERLDSLGSDKGDRTPGRRFVEEVAIALEPASGDGANRRHPDRQLAVLGRHEDPLHSTFHLSNPTARTRRRPASRS